jgi:hypothetical protein
MADPNQKKTNSENITFKRFFDQITKHQEFKRLFKRDSSTGLVFKSL